MISSFARPRPTIAGSREQPPRSGSRPTRVSTSPMTASSATTRRSQASASSAAPPRQAPWICAIVGFAIRSQRFQIERICSRHSRSVSGSWPIASRSPESIPLENIVPAPRTTTQRTATSAAAARSASPSARMSSVFSALRFSGRLRTTWRTAPRSSCRTMLTAMRIGPARPEAPRARRSILLVLERGPAVGEQQRRTPTTRTMYASGKRMASTSPDDVLPVKTATNQIAMATSSDPDDEDVQDDVDRDDQEERGRTSSSG